MAGGVTCSTGVGIGAAGNSTFASGFLRTSKPGRLGKLAKSLAPGAAVGVASLGFTVLVMVKQAGSGPSAEAAARRAKALQEPRIRDLEAVTPTRQRDRRRRRYTLPPPPRQEDCYFAANRA